MKFFNKKKNDTPKPFQPNFQSILCIPGKWSDNSELVRSVVQATEGKFIYAGLIFMNVESGFHFELEVCERDERMIDAFTHSGQLTGITDETLREIEDHKHVVYLKATTGSFEAAIEIAKAGGAILKAGGIALKVETAGKGFDKDVWLNYLDDIQESDLYNMMVVDSIAEDDGSVFSCGMQNFGLKDTIVSDEDFQDAVDLIKIFSFYQIVDKPIIHPNQTFGVAVDAPSYIIREELNQPYIDSEIFGNPFGMWRLERTKR